MKNRKNRMWILGLPVAAAAGMSALAYWFFRFAISRKGETLPGRGDQEKDAEEKRIWKQYWQKHVRQKEWLASRPLEEVSVRSEEGYLLKGSYFPCADAERIVLCAHGYRGNPIEDFSAIAGWLHEHGSDLLLIDQRATNRSEGNFITFGAKEKTDVKRWCDWLEKRNEKQLPVYLYGVSMGASTVLLASGLELPDGVKGIIADCGYSSIRSTFEDRVRESFHLFPYPLMYFMEYWCRKIAGFTLEEGDVGRALETNTLPVLFLHGEEDHFVKPENTLRNFEACKADKKLVIVPGASHLISSIVNPNLYTENLKEFFERCEGKTN
ncbi:MAG: alpha/beta hydrolase [Solobacterium sp.]|nr:alpha/beta hydrolase [Solobacterium sp.]